MQNESEPGHQFTSLRYWNIWVLKFWNWQEMLQETIKRHESYHGISRWVFLARESIYNCGNYWILARDQKWRGIEQTTWWCYNSTRWCFTKYPSGSPSKKDFWRQINSSNRLFKIEHELENMWSLPNAVSLISWNKIKFDIFFKMKIERGLLNSFILGARDRGTDSVQPFVDSFGGYKHLGLNRFAIPDWCQCIGSFKGSESKLSGFRYCRDLWSWLWSCSSTMLNLMWKSRRKLCFKMHQRLCRLCWCLSVLHWLS